MANSQLPPRGAFVVRSSDPAHMIALYNPVIVACFARPPADEELALVRALAAQGLSEGIRGGMLFVAARKNLTGGIDPRVRTFFEHMVRENSAKSGGSAVVVLMDGFAGALVRGFLASLVRLASQRRMLQIFGDTDAAIQWMAAQHGLDAVSLRRAFRGATAHLDLPAGPPERAVRV